MVIARFLLAEDNRLSVTLKVIDDGPPANVGVPAMFPVEAFKLSPEGSVPLCTDHTRGNIPPEAVKFCE